MNLAQASSLRDVLLDPVESTLIDVEGTAKAAILVALHERDGKLLAVLTRRRADLRQHAGQISFPGGRLDPSDPDLVATALREATEEIGLPRAAVTLLGALRPVSVRVSGFALYPFVGAIVRPEAWIPAPIEVEEILELSLEELASTYALQTLTRGGRSVDTPTFRAGPDTIWGATAHVLKDLMARMGLL
ncbi:MAG TPA: CoA pyrophosphatase [Solirubrobacteraceae bacterium]|nr:CoA pyrophosphatase [Solirubrobacteraceae bacterium]